MAKLKAPLMSLGASGQLGKALVFFGWKGLDVVREYIIPSNPKTSGQTTQRGYLTAGVAMIHTAQARALTPLTADDQTSYSTLASSKGKPWTWFNMAVKLWNDVKVAGNTPVVYSSGAVGNTTVTTIQLGVYLNEETGSDLADGKFFFGRSKTNLIHSTVATIVAGAEANIAAADLSAFLTAGVKYYWQFRPDVADPCEGAESGIYTFIAT